MLGRDPSDCETKIGKRSKTIQIRPHFYLFKYIYIFIFNTLIHMRMNLSIQVTSMYLCLYWYIERKYRYLEIFQVYEYILYTCSYMYLLI